MADMNMNVRVAVRCRPMNSKETARGYSSVVTMTDQTVTVIPQETGQEKKEFRFDHCYFIESTQDQVYQDLGAPVVSQALEGFNGTIFAYGQTGSGKTWSMMGNDSDPNNKGIIPRLNDDLWEKVNMKLAEIHKSERAAAESGSSQSETKFMITASFLEIYNEEIKDLLNPSTGTGKGEKKLEVRENPELGIYVDGLCELVSTRIALCYSLSRI